MKNRHMEQMQVQMRLYHSRNPWPLQGRLFIPGTYPVKRALTWLTQVGFVLGRRRVLVWCVHPRMKYAEAIEEQAHSAATLFADVATYKTIKMKPDGAQRITTFDQRDGDRTDRLLAYFDQVQGIEDELQVQGIDCVVRPSLLIHRCPWGTRLELCAPLEVRDRNDIRKLASLAKGLLKREITAAEIFPGYEYGKVDWLKEAAARHQRSNSPPGARLIPEG